jgi:hypothetical protein
MIKNTAFLQLREQAIALRRAGKSRREIRELLGIGSNQTLNEALRGEPPQPWTWRPNAKDDLRARARERFLGVAGIPLDQVSFRVYVHESADVAAAQQFWLEVTRAHPAQFRSPTLKRHNPRTVRKNSGDDYHGCLRIDVLRGTSLYRKIEGWATAVMSSGQRASVGFGHDSNKTCLLPGEDSNLG